MDILKQYEKQNPEPSPQVLPVAESSEDYGILVRMLMRFSHGRIQNEKQANVILFGAACIMAIIAIILLFSGGGRSPGAFVPKGYFVPLPGIPQKNQ